MILLSTWRTLRASLQSRWTSPHRRGKVGRGQGQVLDAAESHAYVLTSSRNRIAFYPCTLVYDKASSAYQLPYHIHVLRNDGPGHYPERRLVRLGPSSNIVQSTRWVAELGMLGGDISDVNFTSFCFFRMQTPRRRGSCCCS